MRIFSWKDGSNTINYYNRSIAAFNWMERNSGQTCAVGTTVTNWCQFNDARVKGGALARNMLYFAVDAKQGGTYAHPFIRVYMFRVAGVAVAGYIDKYASWGSLQYPSLTPNSRGELAMAYSYGGKNADGSVIYPSSAVALNDDFGTFHTSILYYMYGDGNTCQYNDQQGHIYWRWGDYNTVRPLWPVGDVFIAGGWAIKGGNCYDTGHAEAHNIVFGRVRDAGSYSRWENH